MRFRPFIIVAAALTVASPATRAQASLPASGTPPTATRVNPQAAQQEALLAAEELALTRVLAGLRLTAEQMRSLLPILEGGQSKLKQQEEAGRQAVAKLQPGLEDTRRALIAGKEPSTRAEGLVTEQIQTNANKLRQLRADLVRSLRRSLTSVLTSEQQARLGETARSLEVQRQSARWYAQAVTGGRGGGPIGWMGRALDQVRGASESNYPQDRVRIAMRLSDVDGQNEARRARGAPPLSPNDPEVQRQLAPYFAVMDRVRRMPDVTFQQSRPDLALQLWAQRGDTDPRRGGADPDAAIDAMLDRYFLSPQVIPMMQKRLAEKR